MTPTEYWDGDPSLCISYREAQRHKARYDNEQSWLQGLYVYHAVGALVPVMQAFASKEAKPQPYVERPFPTDMQEVREQQEEKDRQRRAKDKVMFEAWASMFQQPVTRPDIKETIDVTEVLEADPYAQGEGEDDPQ